MKAVKITNPLWLPAIAPRVEKLARQLKSPAISYESLFNFLQQAVQFGKEFSEVWVAFKENEPLAFAHWHVCGPPAAGMVCCDYAYTWTKSKKLTGLLMQEFMEFGKKSNCPLYKVLTLDEKRYRYFRALFNKHGINLERQEYVHSLGRK